jgi:hypothetical protein
MWITLAADAYIAVRRFIAGDEYIPLDILEAMSYDESPSVRLTVIRNIRCPKHIIERLRNDPSLAVTKEVERIMKAWQRSDKLVNSLRERLEERLEAIHQRPLDTTATTR